MQKVRYLRLSGAKPHCARPSSLARARQRRLASLEPLEDRLALTTVGPPAAPASANSTFGLYASAVYSALLQRAIDPASMAFWTSELSSGVPLQEMAGAVSHSGEYYGNEVIGPDFQQYLHRGASASDIAVYAAALQAGATDEQVEASLVASDEFYDRAGGTNADWIDAIYTSVLGRVADAAGSAFWLSALSAGATRGQVALEFTQGTEHESTRLQNDYRQVLGWSNVGQSIDFWASQLEDASTSNEDIVAVMAATDDFFYSATGQIVTTVDQPAANSWFLPANAEIDAAAAQSNPQVMFLGDSLTFGWTVYGTNAWTQHFSQLQPLNAGIPGDMTQNILWRLDHGLLNGIHPKLVVLMAGINNVPFNSAADIAAGIQAIVNKLHEELPETKVLVMGVLPTGTNADYPSRQIEAEINSTLRPIADGVNTFYADITPALLDADGTQRQGVFFPDQIHLTSEGYQIYAQALAPLVEQLVA